MNTLKNEVGIYHNVKPEDYFRLGTVRADGTEIERGSDEYIMSRSALREFARCPRAWKLGRPRKASKAFAFGNLMDALCLTPMMIDELIIVQPETYNQTPKEGEFVITPETLDDKPWNPRTKACREWKAEQEKAGLKVLTSKELEELSQDKPWNNLAGYCKDWNARVPRGVEIISADMNNEGAKAMNRVREDDWFSHILSISKTQTVVIWDWTCPVTGEVVRCKAMLDVVPPSNGEDGILLDLKTTADASSEAWNRHVFKFGYHYQAAMYLDGYNAAAIEMDLEDHRASFGHLIIESSQPYETARRILDDEWIKAGAAEYEADLMRYAGCKKSGNFYGYTDNAENGFEIVECPGWVTNKANIEHMMAQDEALAGEEGT